VLLPAVRDAEKDTLIIADGFSCREQITQETDRVPLHLAQVIQMAMQEGEAGKPGEYPEQTYIKAPMPVGELVKTAAILTAGALLLAGGAIYLISTFTHDRKRGQIEPPAVI